MSARKTPVSRSTEKRLQEAEVMKISLQEKTEELTLTLKYLSKAKEELFTANNALREVRQENGSLKKKLDTREVVIEDFEKRVKEMETRETAHAGMCAGLQSAIREMAHVLRGK